MYLKMHTNNNRMIVAACDENLLGKVFQEGEKCLDLKTYRNFYEGKKVTETEFKNALRHFSSVNLVGEGVVKVAVELNIINKKDVKYIQKVPYLQIYDI